MNEQQLWELRLKIQEKCFEYLISIGYPNIDNQKILQELPNIWKYLDQQGLLTPDASYQAFVNAAFSKFNQIRNSNHFSRF